MKRIFFLLVLSLLVLNLSNSCTKDIAKPVEPDRNETELIQSAYLKSSSSDYRILFTQWDWIWNGSGFEWGIVIIFCNFSGGNCLPDVTISSASQASSFGSFKAAYDNGTLTDYFAGNDYKTIFTYIDSIGVIDDLRDGDIELHSYLCSSDDKEYFIGLPSTESFATNDTTWLDKVEFVLVVDD